MSNFETWLVWTVLYAAMNAQYIAEEHPPICPTLFPRTGWLSRSMNSTTYAASRRGDVFLCFPNNQLVEEKIHERRASLAALGVGNQFLIKYEQELCSE